MNILIGADTDGSGTINYTEFIAATLEQSLYTKEGNIRNAFKKFDLNGNGKISMDEIKQVLGAAGVQIDINEDEIQNMINEVDIDGDGELDFEEFLTMMKNNDKLCLK